MSTLNVIGAHIYSCAVMAAKEAVSFAVNLYKTLIASPSAGAGYTYSRGAAGGTITDFEGLVHDVGNDEVMIDGARRVENLSPHLRDYTPTNCTFDEQPDGSFLVTALSSGSISVKYQSPVDTIVVLGDLVCYSLSVSEDIDNATAVLNLFNGNISDKTPIDPDTVLTAYSASQAIIVAVGIAVIGFESVGHDSGDSWVLSNAMFEKLNGQANTEPSEYVNVDIDHGANVNEVKYFNTLNGNTVDGDKKITFAVGAPITTGIQDGYAAFETRTTYAIWTEDLSNAAWVASANMVKSSDGVDLPDGTVGSAETLTATGAGNQTLLQTTTIPAGTSVYSLYLQRKTGTGNIQITLDNGATWTTKALTGVGTWDRVNIVGTTALNDVIGIRIVTDGDAIQAWGHCIAPGGFVTPYIPNDSATASITRPDSLLEYGVANYTTEGSLLVEFEYLFAPADLTTEGGLVGFQADDSIATDSVSMRITTLGRLRYQVEAAGPQTVNIQSGVLSAGTVYKAMIVWSSDSSMLVIDGALMGTIDTSSVMPAVADIDKFFIGMRETAAGVYGHANCNIKSVKKWNKVFTQEEAEAETA